MATTKDSNSKDQAAQAAEEPVQPAQSPRRLDQTVPGGRYLVNGRWLNANGEPVPAPAAEQGQSGG